MFYDVYCALCAQKGLSPSGAATKIGFNRASVTMWKNTGKPPKPELLDKIAAFFNVTTDFLLEKEQKEKPLINGDKELTEYLEELRTRPEMKMLFQLTKNATKEDVEKAVKVIEAMLGK
ncbi:MAG: helix-turn-helix transcriptional regulator [Butyricicoccus pullicaecorum]|nr:helix-turn-helix transcriptional regulator [Butyricicoccus pullicaecorum]